MSVSTPKDTEKLQDDLNKVYGWAVNNTSFNNNKFELIRYGLNTLLKDSTHYFGPDGSEIESKPM